MSCDIELEIEAGSSPGEFLTHVVDAPSGGEPSAVVQLDVDRLLGERDALETTVLASAVSGRRIVAGHEQQLQRVGRELFDALFSGAVLGTYRASFGIAQERGEPLRVVLRPTTPRLAALPWEALFDPEKGAYVCREVSLVRHVPAPFTREPLQVTPPLRVLGLVASPRGLPALDVGAEQDHLSEALAIPVDRGLIEVQWLAQASWDAVQEKLLSDSWHVLHFIGHGDYDIEADQGVIALVGEDGRANMVEAERLADLLKQARPTPRLVVLNSCSSGEQGATDLFSGTAAALVHSGISAVAAMQFTISDPAAISFARGFYTAIANGRSVDDAVGSGRISILGRPHTLEWVTPVLYVRGENTQLFTLAPAAHDGRREMPVEQTSPTPIIAQPPLTEPPPAPPTSDVKQGMRALLRSKVGPPGRRWRPRTVAVAVAALLATAVAIAGVAYWIWGGKPQLYQAPLLAPSEGLNGVPVYREPRLSSQNVSTLQVGSSVYIVCVAIGDEVWGPGPQGQGRQSTRLWNRVRADAHGPDLGFVPDVWVNTGGTQPRGPTC